MNPFVWVDLSNEVQSKVCEEGEQRDVDETYKIARTQNNEADNSDSQNLLLPKIKRLRVTRSLSLSPPAKEISLPQRCRSLSPTGSKRKHDGENASVFPPEKRRRQCLLPGETSTHCLPSADLHSDISSSESVYNLFSDASTGPAQDSTRLGGKFSSHSPRTSDSLFDLSSRRSGSEAKTENESESDDSTDSIHSPTRGDSTGSILTPTRDD